MKNWITKADFLKLRYLGSSIKSEELLDVCVREAMIFDLQPWLTAPLFYDICQKFDETGGSPDTGMPADYEKLLNGGSYEYKGNTISFQGLKACLVYYSFARYTKRDGIKATAAGLVQKADDFSDPVTDKTRQRLAGDDYALAEALKLEIIRFLNCNINDYELWRCATRSRRPTFRSIGD